MQDHGHDKHKASPFSPAPRPATDTAAGGTSGPLTRGSAGPGRADSASVAPVFSHFASDDAPVQRRADSGGGDRAEGVRETAKAGLSGAGGALPHLDTIQRSFGHHDVSGVRSHTDGAAQKASTQLNAKGFASGDKVAFAGQPDLFTAAHEAAHVVQQRQGVHLSQGVGRSGDEHERHADAVAERVVQGRSAQDLLDKGGPSAGPSKAGSGAPVQRKEKLPQGEEGFEKMWDAHPHNYQDDASENTSSEDLLDAEGLPTWIGNTCAVRLSTMLNNTGFKITPQKTKAAGIARAPTYSKKTGNYYILAASEMWKYLEGNFRAADFISPKSGFYKDADAFQAGFDADIKPLLAGRKGIVAFETIFGYGGTGHVDLFDGETLSDAGNWYPCKKIRLWYTVVP